MKTLPKSDLLITKVYPIKSKSQTEKCILDANFTSDSKNLSIKSCQALLFANSWIVLLKLNIGTIKNTIKLLNPNTTAELWSNVMHLQ